MTLAACEVLEIGSLVR